MKRYLSIFLTFIILFGFLCVRLFYLSYDGTNNDFIIQTSIGQYSRRLDITKRRGFIYDCNGNNIAGINHGYITIIDPSKFENSGEQVFPQVVEKLRGNIPFALYTNTAFDNVYSYSIPNYERYRVDTPAAHIIGYLNGDGNGVSGAERYFNDYLINHGGEVYLTYQADAVNNMFGGLPLIICDDGYNSNDGIVLTLDIELQFDVENLWKNLELDKGAIVIADIETGEIIVSASFPTFNANEISMYLNSEDGEFINRCGQSFTPGSLFKILTACAALEIHPNYMYITHECTGEFCYGNIAHGEIQMCEAFAQSCNSYFYNLIEIIGVDKLQSTAVKFGIGQMNHIDFLTVGKGTIDISVPRNAAIGQGGMLCTPYEITRIICSIENDGQLSNLRLFKGTLGNTVNGDKIIGEQIIKPYTVTTLKQMMREVVTDGIGQNAMVTLTDNVGGKTASAQSGQINTDGNEIIHSWFAGYYKSWAITVLCENSDKITAAEVFAEVTNLIKERYQ